MVGDDVAAHARLVSVRDGVLTVAVDDPIWATQLRYLETAVVERATALVGPGRGRPRCGCAWASDARRAAKSAGTPPNSGPRLVH